MIFPEEYIDAYDETMGRANSRDYLTYFDDNWTLNENAGLIEFSEKARTNSHTYLTW